jgi:hypothetical protein
MEFSGGTGGNGLGFAGISRRLGGRPQIELRTLIRLMSAENPLWGAARIHGELLKLGFDVGQSSVAAVLPTV